MANQVVWNNSAFAELSRSLHDEVDAATQRLCASANAQAAGHHLLKGDDSCRYPPYVGNTRMFPDSAVGLIHPNTSLGIIYQNRYHILNSVAH